MDETKTCPCGSDQPFSECCEKYINGSLNAPTAEALMRSRYSAYATANIDYIEQTLLPSTRSDFDRESARKWAERSQWHGFEIVNLVDGGENDNKGTVEFVATYSQKDQRMNHHETATFRKQDGKWYFVEGRMSNEPYRREQPKIGRNDPCQCGSGKKYKKCCGKR